MSAHDNIGLLLRYVACTIQGIEIRFHVQTISNMHFLSRIPSWIKKNVS